MTLIKQTQDGESQDSVGDDDSTARLQKELAAKLSLLRGQNRRLAQLIRQTKQHTSTSRSEIDTLHLSLQNLYYESRHLMGEISACESFPHKHMQLPMVSEAEFLEQHPEWDGKDDGEVMAARIEQEYQDRSSLEEQRKGLLAKKTDLMKENAKRKEELGKLDGDLERFIEAARPIQKTFEKEW